MKLINTLYYLIKPLLPRRFQLWLRRSVINMKRHKYQEVWPILEQAGSAPDGWQGWPQQKNFAVVLTHDVETQLGHDRCLEVVKLEKERGFRSSFNFVPERYQVSPELRTELTRLGFEVGVHGLNHDGKLFQNHKLFSERAVKINRYIENWGVEGFRAPAMHHNLDWIHQLNIQYDLSTFDTDPFEPQSDGVGTIFPFWVPNSNQVDGYVEMPYTLAQDFTPYVLMKEKDITVWKEKVDWIAQKGGMVLVNTHPDYFGFDAKLGLQEFPAHFYTDLLEYIRETYQGAYWHALPKEMAAFWKNTMISN